MNMSRFHFLELAMRSSARAGAALLMLVSVSAFTPAAEPRPANEKAVRAVLDREMKGDFDNLTVKDLCQYIGKEYGSIRRQ
jgi:hypothetical protein